MSRLETPANPWLRRFALFLAFATLVLLALGGLVTSHGVGMAVPDWPNTYGYNMFAFPVSKWVGGILYEHSHRLMAAFVGLLTTVLAVWLWLRETRSTDKAIFDSTSKVSSGARTFLSAAIQERSKSGKIAEPGRLRLWLRTGKSALRTMIRIAATERWIGLGAIALVLVLMGVRILPVYVFLAALALVAAAFSLYQIRQQPGALRWWGILAFAAVILQGVLGGLRVVWLKDQIGIFHAALAQLFFVLVCVIAYLTGKAGVRPSSAAARSAGGLSLEASNVLAPELAAPEDGRTPVLLRQLFRAATLLIFVQLVLGATMRHQHAGLAIPDFPLAYGKLWPATDPGSITLYNQQRLETVALNSITAFQIGLQMAHRLIALSICVLVACCCWLSRRRLGARHAVSNRALIWLGLILAQGLLGAATIWSNKAADIATAHVVVGALALASGTLLWLVCPRSEAVARRETPMRAEAAAPFGAQASAAHGLD